MDMTIDATRQYRANPIQFFLPFVTAIALIFALYWTTFSWWWTEWTAPGSFYAHALFVPFFVAVMIARNRERLAELPWRPSWLGAPLIVVAMIFLMAAQRGDVTVVKSLSFVLMMLGSSLMLIGKAWTRALLFPLLFVVMMMPLIPDQLINQIAFPIQMLSAKIATFLLNAVTLHSVQQGTMIQMESYKMAVELPCSGFKTLVSLLTFCAAFAYLVEGALWKRWTLFLTTIPLSLFINALRITMIGVCGEIVSSKAAATFHDYSGFIVLILAFLFLFNFARVLRCESFLGVPLNDEPEPKKKLTDEYEATVTETPVAEKSSAPTTMEMIQNALQWRPATDVTRRILPFAVGINVIFLIAFSVQGWAAKPPAPKPPIATTQVPRVFAEDGVTFTATDTPDFDKLPRVIQEALSPLRVINRTYSGSDSSQLQLFVTAGNGRKVFHDPHTCFLGSSAQLKDVNVIDVPTKYGTIQVQESRFTYMGMPGEYELMFFYVVENKVVQRTEQVRNSMISQLFLGDSGQPSYFVRITQAAPGTDETQRQQMIRFIAGLWNEDGPIFTGKQPGLSEAPPTPLEDPHPQ